MSNPVPVEIESSSEPWSEYRLADGTVIRVKQVMAEILRVEGEYDEHGQPKYTIGAHVVVNVKSPDSLKKK